MTSDIVISYGDALYELAKDEGLVDEIMPQMKGVRDLLHENPDYVRLLSAPNIGLPERLQSLDKALSGQVHPYLLNFLKILVERGHIADLRHCYNRFRGRCFRDRNILEATAVTAVPLNLRQLDLLSRKLEELTGKKVEMENKVDPSVLGGIRLEYDGKELDGTVRQRLEGLKKSLSETVL